MTKVNDPKNLNGKLFGYEIKYNQVEGQQTPDPFDSSLKVLPKYNGNIAEVDWRTNTASSDYLRRYGYVYDKLNRLSAGFYQREDRPAAQEYFEKITYDLNGNITNLKRTASLDGNTTAGLIDNLTYGYFNNNNSNRLKTVTDSSTDYRGYPDVSGIEIGYDDNGNMTSQQDKGILQINYNFLNLPNYIKFDKLYYTRGVWQNVNTQYFYRADGLKQRKEYRYSENSVYRKKTTDYLDGFQYEEMQNVSPYTLKFVPTAEGYFNFENNKYIYNYVDHLGNVRLSYFHNGSGIEVLEENNYYPFGLKHEGYNALAGNSAYQYKYNGKELQETGMYDYGARFYMPDIGRWGVVDPLAEQYRRWSPYNYTVNNPVHFIDPDGRGVTDVIITGDLKDKAFKQLQSKTTNLDLKIDKNGKVTGSVKEGATATKAEQKLLEATNDKSVIVNLEATSANQTADGSYIVSGAYEGNKVVQGENGEIITEGYQILNPNQAEKVDKAEKSPQGSAALHEILESYISASETPGSSKENKQSYLNAHNKASALDPDRIRNGMPGKDVKKNRDGSITEKIYLDINGKKYPLYENKIPK